MGSRQTETPFVHLLFPTFATWKITYALGASVFSTIK